MAVRGGALGRCRRGGRRAAVEVVPVRRRWFRPGELIAGERVPDSPMHAYKTMAAPGASRSSERQTGRIDGTDSLESV